MDTSDFEYEIDQFFFGPCLGAAVDDVYSVDRKKRGMAGAPHEVQIDARPSGQNSAVGNNKDGVTRQPGIEH
jgi:hypothetical protein